MDTINEAETAQWAPASKEYFDNYRQGVWDSFNQLQLILPEPDIKADMDRGDLIIGRAGVDGIYFCFRKGKSGVHAYYGIDDAHVLVAPDITTLVKRWMDGKISL